MKSHSQFTASDDPLTSEEEALHETRKLDNFSQRFYYDWDLEDKLIHELVAEIEGRLKLENITGARRAFLLADLVRALNSPPPSLPKQAPELYRDRHDRSETADDFVRRVYRAWLEQPGGLPRPVLRTIDEPCYRALYKQGIPDDLATMMPTARGKAAQYIGLDDSEVLAERRRKARARQERHLQRVR